jgi:hypothetical protein
LLDLADEFETMAVLVGMKTPTLDELLESVRQPFADVEQKEVE